MKPRGHIRGSKGGLIELCPRPVVHRVTWGGVDHLRKALSDWGYRAALWGDSVLTAGVQ